MLGDEHGFVLISNYPRKFCSALFRNSAASVSRRQNQEHYRAANKSQHYLNSSTENSVPTELLRLLLLRWRRLRSRSLVWLGRVRLSFSLRRRSEEHTSEL